MQQRSILHGRYARIPTRTPAVLLLVVLILTYNLLLVSCATTDPLKGLQAQIDQLRADQQILAQEVALAARADELQAINDSLEQLQSEVTQESEQVLSEIAALNASSASKELVATLQTELTTLTEGYDLIESMIMRLMEYGNLASSDDLVEFGYSLMDISEKLQSVDEKLERFKAAMASFVLD